MKDMAIQEKVNERAIKEQEKARARDEIAAIKEEKRDFNRHIGVLLVNPLLEKLSEMGVSQVPDWKRTAISALLSWESDTCICEREITPEIRARFEELLDKKFEERPVEFLGERAVQLLLRTEGKALERRFYELESRKAGLETGLAACEDEIEKLNKEIGEQKDLSFDIRAKETTRKNAADDFETYRRKRDENNGIITEKNASLERMRNKLVDEEQMNKDIKLKSQHLQSCKDCKSAINVAIESLVDETRKEVQQLASDIFVNCLTNNPKLYRGIEITDNFELKIKTVAGTTLPVWIQAPSAGQSQIIATSFIAALNRYTAREAPVVIDTPIGRLDPVHKNNLIKYYPKIGPQIVILYQPNELTDTDIEPIGKYVSSEWHMTRDPANPDATIISKE
jgi:DNA sulfur modification protein DndD